MPSPFTVGSTWLIKRGGAADQHIEVTTATPTEFTAQYIGIADSSVFSGEVRERETQALVLKQHNASAAYVAYQIGLISTPTPSQPHEYHGHWCDVAGDQGDFHLSKAS